MWAQGFGVCPEHAECGLYRVAAGESLAGIAARFALTPAQLLELNPFVDPAELFAGQRLLVPAVGRRLTHVRYGEGRTELLTRTGCPPEDFRRRNPHLAAGAPLPGQRVWL